ncbi:L,D-transpeptidase [Roseibium aggregatum]|uniref:L,D-transpeptidase n=1 Tax=Roseibium aggregatum TaxID=187304 RepID=A0A939EEX0_9HYPH|nr:L,D-transpeptidase [Roseibium aggregatum]MBN9670299.1 L,D-transpeptidase [Roseibium aggregatum]
MKTLIFALFTLLAGTMLLPETASARAGFFDHSTNTWVTPKYHPGGKSPVRRKKVRYDGPYAPGTLVIDTSERRLYHVLPGGKAMKYGVGVGKDGFQWAGTHRISRKAEWPGWTPPPQMRARERAKGRILPAHMPGGPNNPLGARALYIGSTLYRIHGTTEPWTIGSAVSSGCIRLANEDIIHLYSNVKVGSKVVVKR